MAGLSLEGAVVRVVELASGLDVEVELTPRLPRIVALFLLAIVKPL